MLFVDRRPQHGCTLHTTKQAATDICGPDALHFTAMEEIVSKRLHRKSDGFDTSSSSRPRTKRRPSVARDGAKQRHFPFFPHRSVSTE